MPRKPAAKLEKAEKIVKELMEKYHNCAQCTLVAIQEISGVKDDLLAKASTGFAGGIGGTQSVCGALSGGVLALGMKYGRDVSLLNGPPEEALKGQVAAVEQAARLVKWFEREFGTTSCTELRKSHMGTDLSMGIPWQNAWANKLGMRVRCAEYAAGTARRVLMMLDDPDLDIED
jgi:C_GCAxxG_C_C family probable redox protein